MTTPSTGNHAPVTGKEEGELSASDDEVQPMQTSTRAPLAEYVSVPSANIQRPQAGLNLVSTISCVIPIAPEYIWVEAGEILSNINGFKTRAERFLKKALSLYPMSVKLWRCYRSLCRSIEERRGIEIDEAARKKGITLD